MHQRYSYYLRTAYEPYREQSEQAIQGSAGITQHLARTETKARETARARHCGGRPRGTSVQQGIPNLQSAWRDGRAPSFHLAVMRAAARPARLVHRRLGKLKLRRAERPPTPAPMSSTCRWTPRRGESSPLQRAGAGARARKREHRLMDWAWRHIERVQCSVGLRRPMTRRHSPTSRVRCSVVIRSKSASRIAGSRVSKSQGSERRHPSCATPAPGETRASHSSRAPSSSTKAPSNFKAVISS